MDKTIDQLSKDIYQANKVRFSGMVKTKTAKHFLNQYCHELTEEMKRLEKENNGGK